MNSGPPDTRLSKTSYETVQHLIRVARELNQIAGEERFLIPEALVKTANMNRSLLVRKSSGEAAKVTVKAKRKAPMQFRRGKLNSTAISGKNSPSPTGKKDFAQTLNVKGISRLSEPKGSSIVRRRGLKS